MNHRKVMEQALDALHLWHWTKETTGLDAAHDALRDALAEPEQEPLKELIDALYDAVELIESTGLNADPARAVLSRHAGGHIRERRQ